MKKKKLILLLTSFTAVTVSLSVVFSTQADLFSSRASDKPSSLNCDYYFNEENGYTSIYDLNSRILDGNTNNNYKSWGTISCIYGDSNNSNTSYFVQSTDKYGNSSGIVLYKHNGKNYSVGNVITFSGGTLSLYNGQPQIQSPNSSKDYETNPSPITCRELTYRDFQFSSDSEQREKILAGSTLSRASNMHIVSVSNDRALVSFDDEGTQTITAYYGSSSSTNAIYSIFDGFLSNNKKVDITGHVCLFKKNSTNMFQLYVRNSSYISEAEEPVDNCYIEVRDYVDEYDQYDTLITPDVYFVDPDEGTSYDVSNSCSFSYDFTIAGYRTVDVTYYFGSNVYTTWFEVYVNESDPGEKYIISISPFNPTTIYVMGDTFVTPGLRVEYNTGVEIIYSGFDISEFNNQEPGKQTITMSFGEFTTSYSVYVYSEYPSGFESYDINSSNLTISGNYATGNYGTSGSMGYYRALKPSDDAACVLLPYGEISDMGIDIDSQPGALYNTNPFRKMKTITIKYKTSSSSGFENPKLYLGENNYIGYVELEYKTTKDFAYVDLAGYEFNYFKLTSGDTKFTVYSIFVEYYDIETTHGSGTITDTNYTDYRINPTVFSGELEDGVSQVTVPINVTIDTNNNTYTVNEYKTYTYYSFDYAQSHAYLKNEIALTDPVDVANYYTIFGEIPANYAFDSDLYECNDVFGSLTRKVQQFSSTTGYATSVPYNCRPGTSKPVYYEFDIAINSSYDATVSSTRGVGRVIGWQYGFNSDYGYDTAPVCIFTDDHYATFQEFNNLGGWCTRFDAEKTPLLRRWKQSITLN